jgi:hypothetical protein
LPTLHHAVCGTNVHSSERQIGRPLGATGGSMTVTS